jgi:hypothetical protein
MYTMRIWVRLLVNGAWSSRIQLVVVLFVMGVLSVGQGKELVLSLQGSVQYNSLLAIISASLFAYLLGHWTYVSIVLAPIRSHWIDVWKTDEEADNDPRLRRSAAYVAAIYATAILAFALTQFILIGQATGIILAIITDAILIVYLLGVTTKSKEGRGSTMSDALPRVIRERLINSRFPRLSGGSVKTAAVSLLISPILYSVWERIPSESAFPFSSFGTAFLSFSILAPWLFLVFVLTQSIRFPIAFVLFMAPFIAETLYEAIGLHGNFYAVRTLEQPPSMRPEISESTRKWTEQGGSAVNTRPVVFITAAGGGIRAAYWTAAILGHLEDCISDFHTTVFSISSVSGGSLGAAAFASLLADLSRLTDNQRSELRRSSCRQPILIDSSRTAPIGYHQSFLKSFLSRDYLAPVVREAILGDIPRSLVPWSSSISEPKDRGVALEVAWEEAWKNTCVQNSSHCPGAFSFSTSFSNLSTQAGWLPLLFLNGVHEETGKRIITSTGHVVADLFLDATDFFDLTQRDIRTSTAVLNSARFPIISPSGRLFRTTSDGASVHEKSEPGLTARQVGHVIDGGYFDNNGTVTSQEIAIATMKSLRFARLGDSCPQGSRRAIFLEILNDTTMTELDSDRDNLDNDVSLASRVRELSGLSHEIPFHPLVVAVNGLETSRAARAVHSSKVLARYARSLCDGYYFVMPLCRGIMPQPALGWMLSEESRAAMDKMLVGGVDAKLYSTTQNKRDFFDCYNLVQNNLVKISNLLR